MRLKDICEINKKTYSVKEKWPVIYYLDTQNINKGQINEVKRYNTEWEKMPSRAKRKVSKNDILYSMVRPNQHHYGIIQSEKENFLVSTGFAVITVNENIADPYFIYYFLTQAQVIEYLQNIAEQSTSTYPAIKPSDIEELAIDLPDLEKQKRIGKFLRSIDETINVKKNINDNLQQQAKLIYEEIFLKNPNGNTTSGTLDDIATITMGQSPRSSSYNENSIGEVFYQGRAEFGFRFPTRHLFTTEPKRMAESGDVLLSVRAPVGDLNVAYEKCCIGRGLSAIHSKTGNSSFVLYTMFALKPRLDVFNGEGTVFGSINRNDLSNLPINIPPTEEIAKFEAIVRPMDTLIRANYEEICRLQSVRDGLLPRLMSGEINVSSIQL